jgi:hypothetical protein
MSKVLRVEAGTTYPEAALLVFVFPQSVLDYGRGTTGCSGHRPLTCDGLELRQSRRIRLAIPWYVVGGGGRDGGSHLWQESGTI